MLANRLIRLLNMCTCKYLSLEIKTTCIIEYYAQHYLLESLRGLSDSSTLRLSAASAISPTNTLNTPPITQHTLENDDRKDQYVLNLRITNTNTHTHTRCSIVTFLKIKRTRNIKPKKTANSQTHSTAEQMTQRDCKICMAEEWLQPKLQM